MSTGSTDNEIPPPITTIERSLRDLGFTTEEHVEQYFSVITASRKEPDREIRVRMELSRRPVVTIQSKNGFSMKYVLNEDAVNKSLKAIGELCRGLPFHELWNLLS